MGPAVPTSPATITPQPPAVNSLAIAGSVLSTRGGQLIDVTGFQVGGTGAVVALTLSNGRYEYPSPTRSAFSTFGVGVLEVPSVVAS